MTTYSVEFLDKVEELARLAAAEGLSVNVLVRPVLCPMDDKTAAFAALMGAFVGQSSYVGMTTPPTRDASDPEAESFEELKKRYEARQSRDCRCANGECSCRKEDFFANGASSDPATWLDKRDSASEAEPKFGEPMGFGIG